MRNCCKHGCNQLRQLVALLVKKGLTVYAAVNISIIACRSIITSSSILSTSSTITSSQLPTSVCRLHLKQCWEGWSGQHGSTSVATSM